MNDALYEQLVKRKARPIDYILRILIIAALALLFFFGTMIFGSFAIMVVLILAIVVYCFVFPRFNVEYEYTLLNHDLEIDAIYNRANRKKQVSFDIKQAEIIAPNNSPRLHSYSTLKVRDFSSGEDSSNIYAIVLQMEQEMLRILIEPDQDMIHHMQQWMGSRMFTD